jgi:hypothetical protein
MGTRVLLRGSPMTCIDARLSYRLPFDDRRPGRTRAGGSPVADVPERA